MPRNRSDHGQQRPGLLRVRQRRRVLQVNKQTTNVITTTKKARERERERERLEMPESEQRCPSCHHRRKLARANPIEHHPCFFHQNCKYIDMFCISPPPGRAGVGGRDLQGDHGGHRLHVLLTDFEFPPTFPLLLCHVGPQSHLPKQ